MEKYNVQKCIFIDNFKKTYIFRKMAEIKLSTISDPLPQKVIFTINQYK